MKKTLLLSFVALWAVSAVAGAFEPNISVFASFVRRIAKQRGISKSAAADMLYGIGVRGFDAGPGEDVVTNEVTIVSSGGIGVATGTFDMQLTTYTWTAYQNLWKCEDTK